MVHRDPETGKFVAGDGDGHGRPTYSDLEWLQITFDSSVGAGPADNDDSVATQETVDVHDVLNLGNDELGEIVTLYRMFHGSAILDDDATATAAGSIELSGNLEINSGETEWALSDQIDTPTSARSRPGFVDAIEVRAAELVKDTANGVAAGTGPASITKEREMSWYQMGLSQGPALDANDDLDFRFELNRDSFVHAANVKCVYQIGMMPHQIEGTRRSFAIPR